MAAAAPLSRRLSWGVWLAYAPVRIAVEERRFSAALSAPILMGFSPSDSLR
jgi:hypothetical protein